MPELFDIMRDMKRGVRDATPHDTLRGELVRCMEVFRTARQGRWSLRVKSEWKVYFGLFYDIIDECKKRKVYTPAARALIPAANSGRCVPHGDESLLHLALPEELNTLSMIDMLDMHKALALMYETNFNHCESAQLVQRNVADLTEQMRGKILPPKFPLLGNLDSYTYQRHAPAPGGDGVRVTRQASSEGGAARVAKALAFVLGDEDDEDASANQVTAVQVRDGCELESFSILMERISNNRLLEDHDESPSRPNPPVKVCG